MYDIVAAARLEDANIGHLYNVTVFFFLLVRPQVSWIVGVPCPPFVSAHTLFYRITTEKRAATLAVGYG